MVQPDDGIAGHFLVTLSSLMVLVYASGKAGKLMSSFFFQAEDGIRDGRVTGVQTCALPICIDAEYLGDEKSQTLHWHRPMRKQEVVPTLFHQPRPRRQIPWPMSSCAENI